MDRVDMFLLFWVPIVSGILAFFWFGGGRAARALEKEGKNNDKGC